MTKKKNVLFITYGFSVGGAETLLVNLLNNFDKSKIVPTIVSIESSDELVNKLVPNIPIITILRKWKYDLTISRKIASLIKNNNIEIIFTIDLFCFFFARIATFLAKNNIPILITLHSTKARSLKEFILNFIYFRLLKKNDSLIGVCENQSIYLSKKYFVPLKRFKTIYNGVDVNYWTLPPTDFDKINFRLQFNILIDDIVIIQVAGFRKEKKHENSIKALKYLHEKYRIKAYILFVGGGDKIIEQRIKNMVNDYGLNKYVIFCGKQSEVLHYYWGSDIFTLSSVAIETFSIAALEAMACGLPCVLTDLSGAREMVTNNINGLIVPVNNHVSLADAWYKVITEKQHKYRPQNIREIVLYKYSLNETISKYQSYINE